MSELHLYCTCIDCQLASISIAYFPTSPHISFGTFVLFALVTSGRNLRAEDTLKSIFSRYDHGEDILTGSGPTGIAFSE